MFFKEVLGLFSSFRIILILVVCLIVFPTSVYMSTMDYRSRLTTYQEASHLNESRQESVSDVIYDGAKGLRPPSALMFLSQGLEIVMPNVAESSRRTGYSLVEMTFNNEQGLDYIYDYYQGTIDLAFLLSVVLTFFAVVLTHDAVSGEKETGTLKQILSNAVPRSKVILAKMVASYLALIVPFLASMLLSLLVAQRNGVLPRALWPHVFLGILFSLLLIGAFLNLGILVSALYRRAVSSLVTLLFLWVFFYAGLPRLSVIVSRLLYPVESQQLFAFEKNQARLENEKACEAEIDELVARDEASPERQESIRQRYQFLLARRTEDLDLEMEKKRQTQMTLITTLARVSPVSCFVRPFAENAQTGWLQYQEFLQAAHRFAAELNSQVFAREQTLAKREGRQYSFQGDESARAPSFQFRWASFEALLMNVLPDSVLLVVYNLLFFVAAYVAFIKYDPR